MTKKRFTITHDFEEHHRQIRDNGHIIMGCFVEQQAEVIVNLLNEQHEQIERLKGDFRALDEVKCELAEENEQLKQQIEDCKDVNVRCCNDYSAMRRDVWKYKKENRQLKKTNQELNDELQETIGYLSLKSGVEKENEQLKQQNKGIQDKVWKLLELLEKEKGIDKRKIIDWWNGDV